MARSSANRPCASLAVLFAPSSQDTPNPSDSARKASVMWYTRTRARTPAHCRTPPGPCRDRRRASGAALAQETARTACPSARSTARTPERVGSKRKSNTVLCSGSIGAAAASAPDWARRARTSAPKIVSVRRSSCPRVESTAPHTRVSSKGARGLAEATRTARVRLSAERVESGSDRRRGHRRAPRRVPGFRCTSHRSSPRACPRRRPVGDLARRSHRGTADVCDTA